MTYCRAVGVRELAALACAWSACGDCDRSPNPAIARQAPASVEAPTPVADASARDAGGPADVTLALAPVCEPGASVPSQLAIALTVPASEATVFQLDDDVLGTAGMAALITNESATDGRRPVRTVRASNACERRRGSRGPAYQA